MRPRLIHLCLGRLLITGAIHPLTQVMAFASKSSSVASEQSERLSPWTSRWKESRIGWHEGDVNMALKKYAHLIVPPAEEEAPSCSDSSSSSDGVSVFVPLCGKTVDMAFFATQPNVAHVVGIDGVRKALDEFAEEHSALEIKQQEQDDTEGETTTATTTTTHFERFVGKKITLLKGDFFDMERAGFANKFDVVWDRASLVAIQPTLREEYVKTIGTVAKPGASILLVTFDRREGTLEARKAGPPFSIDQAEVQRLFGSADWVESIQLVDEFDTFVTDPSRKERFQSSGVTSLFEMVFLIKAKA